MPEPVEYWKWTSPTQLGLVTAASVYHWDVEVRPPCPALWRGGGAPPLPPLASHLCAKLTPRPVASPPLSLPPSPLQGGSEAPVKVFDRTPNLAGAQIISYRVSPDAKWCVLIGITQGLPER